MRRALIALLAVGALLGTAAAAQAATVYFAGAIAGRTIRPRTVYLSADGTLDVIKVHWRRWGAATAVGSGTAAYHGCTPDCAAGREHRTHVTVRLSRIRRCKGARYYTHVALVKRSGKLLFPGDLRESFKPCS